MKKILALTILAFLVAGISELNGQDLKRFVKGRKGTAEEATEDRVGKEADKAVVKEVNKALDKLFGKEEEKAEEPAVEPNSETQDSEAEYDESEESDSSSGSRNSRNSSMEQKAIMSAMGISMGTANVKPVYEFEGFIEMTVTEFENGEKEGESTTYKTYLDSKSLDYGMIFNEPGNKDLSIMIFDTENSLMLTLSDADGEKTGFAINYTPEQAGAIEEDLKEEDITDPYAAYMTGRTKKILGYNCDEYVIEDDYGINTMWITNEMDKEMKKSYLQNSIFSGMYVHANNSKGFLMENTTEDKDDHDKSIMTVTDIDLNKKSTISTVGYNIMSMGATMQEE